MNCFLCSCTFTNLYFSWYNLSTLSKDHTGKTMPKWEKWYPFKVWQAQKGEGEEGGRKGKGKGPLSLFPIPLPSFPSSLSPTPYPFRRLLRRLCHLYRRISSKQLIKVSYSPVLMWVEWKRLFSLQFWLFLFLLCCIFSCFFLFLFSQPPVTINHTLE